MKEKSTKTIFLLFVTNAQFVLKLDNFASPKCYFDAAYEYSGIKSYEHLRQTQSPSCGDYTTNSYESD